MPLAASKPTNLSTTERPLLALANTLFPLRLINLPLQKRLRDEVDFRCAFNALWVGYAYIVRILTISEVVWPALQSAGFVTFL
jgi:hypothetical protein